MSDSSGTSGAIRKILTRPEDLEAWRDFAGIARRVLRRQIDSDQTARTARRRLNRDLVARLDARGESDKALRPWLFREGRLILCEILARPSDRPRGGARDDGDEEFRRQLFRLAAGRVRVEFTEADWASFWQTRIRRLPTDVVARSLGIATATVHRARSRVMQRVVRAMERIEGLAEGSGDGAC